MVIRFASVQTFPFSLQRLWSSCATPDYAVRKYKALGATAVQVQRFVASGDLIEVDLVREVPVRPDSLPAWSRPWAPKRQLLQHETHWQRTSHRHALVALSVVPLRLPVRAQATGTLAEAQGETRMELSWQVRASLPGLTAALERLFQRQVEAGLAEDRDFTVRYVTECAWPTAARGSEAGAPRRAPVKRP